MKNRLLNYFCFVFFVFFIIYFFGLMNYDKSTNPDILNYIANFNNANWSYDIGFEYYQHILRDVLGFDFNLFWLTSLALMAVLYILVCGTQLPQVPFAMINFFFLAETFGTQVRYFIATLFFVFCLKYFKRLHLWCGLAIASIFHYGLVLLASNYVATHVIKNKTALVKKKTMFVFASIFIFYFLSTIIVQVLLPYTRFSYYAGSFYMESKSLSSLVYIFLSFSFLYFVFIKKYKEHNDIFIFSLLLLYVVLCTSAIAVLSGRLFLVYLILEPLVAMYIFGKSRQLYFVFLALCLFKTIPLLGEFYVNNF